jgi:hypothetical protein
MSDDVFANLPRQAEALGAPVAHYRNRPGLFLLNVAARALIRVVAGAAFVGMALRPLADPDRDRGVGSTLLLALSFAVGVVCLLSAVRVVWSGLRRRGAGARGVAHCPGGLVCVLPERTVVAPWDEIDQIWDGGRRFRTRGGAEVVLPPSLEGWPLLAELVFRETIQRLAVCASAAILGGRAVEFGPITVTRDAIAARGRRVAWADVGDVVVAWGRFRVTRKGERLAALDVPLAEVPNPRALWALVERLREGGFGQIVIGPGAAEPPDPE